MKQDLLSVDELAESLNVTKLWVYSHICYDDPEALPRIIVNNDIFFKFDEVLRWLIDHAEPESI